MNLKKFSRQQKTGIAILALSAFFIFLMSAANAMSDSLPGLFIYNIAGFIAILFTAAGAVMLHKPKKK